ARGFVREALSIVAWVGAAAITLYGFNSVYAVTMRFVTTPLLADLVAGAGLFVTSLIVLTIITGYVARFAASGALSPINRTRGFERAQEAQKAMRAYANPAAPSTAKPGEVAAPSYKPGDRSDMDRLIKSTR